MRAYFVNHTFDWGRGVKHYRESGRDGVAGGWPVYRRLNGIPITEHRITKNFVEIADGTDDIDYPADYQRLTSLWS